MKEELKDDVSQNIEVIVDSDHKNEAAQLEQTE